MNFKVNFRDVVSQLSPHNFRQSIYLRWIFSLSKGLSDVNDNGIIINFFGQKNQSLFQFTRFITRFLQVEQTTLGVQKYLNELFDPTDELIEIINNNSPLLVDYDFNLSEQHVVDFDYNAWDSTFDYAATDEFVLAPDGNVYESNTTPNINNEPVLTSAEWDLISTADEYLFNNLDIFPPDYTIKIPVNAALDPDNLKLIQATVNQFNAAGKSYEAVRLDLSPGDPGFLLFEKN